LGSTELSEKAWWSTEENEFRSFALEQGLNFKLLLKTELVAT